MAIVKALPRGSYKLLRMTTPGVTGGRSIVPSRTCVHSEAKLHKNQPGFLAMDDAREGTPGATCLLPGALAQGEASLSHVSGLKFTFYELGPEVN